MDKKRSKQTQFAFTSGIQRSGEIAIIRVPAKISSEFPTRGMVLAGAEINGHNFTAELEPDGEGGHFLEAGSALLKKIKTGGCVSVKVVLKLIEDWPAPKLPADLKQMLNENAGAGTAWSNVTSKAKWEWLRWLRAAKTDETRRKRLITARSMLVAGKKRPCCFNSRQCLLPGI